MKHFIAVDVGGTQLRAACYLADSNQPINVKRIPTQSKESSPLERIVGVIKAVWPEGQNVSGIGLAVPGAVDPYAGMVYISPNIPGWIDLPLRDRVQEQFEAPVAIGNDANMAALGEWRFGAGRGHHHMLYFTISTGIGGGIIENDRLLLGARGLAGEVGHIMIEPDGPLCGCGQRGHLEALASGTAIARWTEEQIASGQTSILVDKIPLSAREVSIAAKAGDELAVAAFERAGTYFGRTLADYLHLFNPTAVILGGGVTQSGDLFFKPMQKALEKHVISQHYLENLTITRAQLGDDAGLTGALALAHTLV
jgi:glucokinase